MPAERSPSRVLSDAEIEQFVRDGFVRIDEAFPSALADEARAILWHDTGCAPDDLATWRAPVVRLGHYTAPPFVAAANTPVLHAAFDALVGAGRWRECRAVGTFPVRFPLPQDAGDTGWHIDVSFALPDDPADDFLSWRANLASRGRALLMLMLFSDVGPDDAPTRLRVGSHQVVARELAAAGERGSTLRELAAEGFASSAHCPEVTATGAAGTVYLCHPFMVHAAQVHRGRQVRFLAQPPLLPRPEFEHAPAAEGSPVARATAAALAG